MFGRLYRYARSTAVGQLENFTTEALAAAIRADPVPLFDVLTSHGVLPERPPSSRVLVTTQEVISGVGVIDLVVRCFRAYDLVTEIWIEAKIWAAESGDQLERYQSHLTERTDTTHRALVTLGPRPLRDVSAYPWVSWQSIRDVVASATRAGPLWRELTAFLEETRVADESTDPVSAREAASLPDAFRLFKKATRVLTDVNELGLARWPSWGWGGKDQITQQIVGQFQRWGRYAIATTNRPVYLVLGYTDLQATGEAHLTVWVESDPKKPDIRAQILAAADAGGLEGTWMRRLDTWQALSRTRRAATIEGSAPSIDWFVAQLEELAVCGIAPT